MNTSRNCFQRRGCVLVESESRNRKSGGGGAGMGGAGVGEWMYVWIRMIAHWLLSVRRQKTTITTPRGSITWRNSVRKYKEHFIYVWNQNDTYTPYLLTNWNNGWNVRTTLQFSVSKWFLQSPFVRTLYFKICTQSQASLVVQWLGYMTLTHETRVQFPAREKIIFFKSHINNKSTYQLFFFNIFPLFIYLFIFYPPADGEK